MPTPVRTVWSSREGLILDNRGSESNVVTFAGAATLLAGTILAVDSVSLKWVPYVKGGVTNQNGIPKAVLTYALTSTGAGDYRARALVAGDVAKDKLVINADGSDVNIDQAVKDLLRDYSIIVKEPAQQLNALDN